jgi:pimeloyl-ACP methyl ester carboxylesterase
MHHRRFAALTAACLVLAAACSGGGAHNRSPTPSSTQKAKPATTSTTGTTAPSTRSIRWHRCGGGAQCGELTVPRDYAQPDGATIKVAVLRYPATHPKERIGPLLVNPGGPGASAVQFLRDDLAIFPASLRNRFDIIAVDSRGTGGTIPVHCHADLDAVNAVDNTPDTPVEQQHIADVAKQLAAGCEERSGAILPFLSTQNSARDMDQVRAALGAAKLTYVGYSYGTYLGALYANFFPDRVRALVLDGAVDPSLSSADSSLQQSVGFERELQAFFADCAQRTSCTFHNGGDPATAFDALIAKIDRAPLPTGAKRRGRLLGPGEADLGIAQVLYGGTASWPDLAIALAQAQRGDGTALLEMSDRYTDRQPDGSYSTQEPAFWAIACLDSPPPPGGLDGLHALAALAKQSAPHFGEANVNLGTVCDFWPAPPVADPGPIHAKGAPPIVVIGTTGDPATPLAWAESLAKQLDSGRLIIAKGEQHTSFLGAQNSCVDKLVITYLVQLQPPQTGTRCD